VQVREVESVIVKATSLVGGGGGLLAQRIEAVKKRIDDAAKAEHKARQVAADAKFRNADRESTPQEATALANARAALSEMLKGGTPPPPTKPRPTGPPAHIPSASRKSSNEDIPPGRTTSTPDAARLSHEQTQQTPAQRRLSELNDYQNEKGIYSKDPAAQKRAVEELHRLMAAEATQDEKDDYANLSVDKLREANGIERPDLPSNLRSAWSEENEAVALIALHEQGVAPETARQLHTWYIDRDVMNLGRFTEADVNDFREFAKGKLSPEFIESLISWHGGVE
jgi:hypothetical protein